MVRTVRDAPGGVDGGGRMEGMTTSEATATIETLREHEAAVADRSRLAQRFPDRVVVGANGAYWRDYGDFYSMCPVSDDNDPVVPVAVYALVGSEGLGRTDPGQARAIDELVLAALAWEDHPTPANIGRLHRTVARYRGK